MKLSPQCAVEPLVILVFLGRSRIDPVRLDGLEERLDSGVEARLYQFETSALSPVPPMAPSAPKDVILNRFVWRLTSYS